MKLNFIIIILIGVFLFLSGCSTVYGDSLGPSETYASAYREDDEMPISTNTVSDCRLPRLSTHTDTDNQGYFVETLTSPESLYYNGGNLKPEYFAKYIYRQFEPQENATTEDLLTISKQARSASDDWDAKESKIIGDLICPMLYSDDIVSLSDDELTMLFETAGFNVSISSAKKDTFHLRVINLSFTDEYDITPTLLNSICFTFLQCWNDTNVWAQPVAERSRNCITKCTLMESDTSLYLILEGVAEETRSSYTYKGFTYLFENELWKPCTPQIVPEIELVLNCYENPIIMQEGFIANRKID